MYWKRIKPSQLTGFNTFPSAYPIDSQVVGMYVFVQCVDVDLCKSVYHNTDELSNEIVRKNGTPIGFCNLQVNL